MERLLQNTGSQIRSAAQTLLSITAALLLLSVALWPQSLSTQTGPARQLELRFTLQETRLDEGHTARLRAFHKAAARPAPYWLVQGFACDRGGYVVSRRVAGERGAAVQQKLQALLAKPAAISAESVVIYTPDVTAPGRERHRRAVVQAFATAADRAAALRNANREAERLNAAARAGLQQAAEAQAGPGVAGETLQNDGDGESNSDRSAEESGIWWYVNLVLIILLLVLIAVAVWTIMNGRSPALATNPAQTSATAVTANPGHPHELNESEAASLAILTGGAVEALPARTEDESETADDASSGESSRQRPAAAPAEKSRPAAKSVSRSSSSVKAGTDTGPNRSVNLMATQKKKSKSKITPISIRGAVDRDFEDKSLSELSRSPIDALEGLTPRHARMLEEAFGIKTIEDLARLKYVEIARAIVVLGHYEK